MSGVVGGTRRRRKDQKSILIVATDSNSSREGWAFALRSKLGDSEEEA